ncbi:MAG: CHASE3 domain-containing protein [Oligoflexus sp.]|nr:CHASE3 domain-containing protein [Oligoflexus sp.]
MLTTIKKLSQRTDVYFGIILLILTSIGLSSYQGIVAIMRASNERSHTRQVIAEVDTLLTLIVSAETGQRGFLLTNEPMYLATYSNSLQPLEYELAHLKHDIADDSESLALLERMEMVLRKKMDELAVTVQLKKDGKSKEADAIVMSNVGLEYMGEIRHFLVDELKKRELLKLKHREEHMDSTLAAMVLKVGLASFIAVLLAAIGAYLLTRELRERKHIEAILKREQQRLSNIIETQLSVATAGLSVEKVMQVILDYLARMGYSADVVNNGREAITALNTAHYDIVLMDCQMPELDAYEAAGQIRGSLEKYKDITIIAMTANAIKGDRERCLAAGMNDYISKPLKVREIIDILSRWLALRDDEHAPANVSRLPGPAVKGEDILDMETIDLLGELPGTDGRSLVAELFENFSVVVPDRIQAMRDALLTKNLKVLAFEAHALKGGAGTLGLKRLCEVALKIENCQRGTKEEDLPQLLVELDTEFQMAVTALSRFSDKAS